MTYDMTRMGLVWLSQLLTVAVCSAIDFDHEVVPILRTHCGKCHSGVDAKGGFSLNTRELFLESGVAEPGEASESHFLDLIRSDDAELQMPPPNLPRVPADEQAVLVRWVDAGMPWTAGFSFAGATYTPPLLPRTVKLDSASDANPVDQLLQQYFAANQLTPPDPIDDAMFLRRASLDLVGLLPTPDQLKEFLADSRPDKRERLVDSLLDRNVDYAEHWLTFWNDLLRNDYTGTGFITGGRKQISGWLYRALVDNKPFDQFTQELIAPPSDASRGFIDGIKWRGTVSAGQTNEIQFAQSVAQSFLGINLKCASCHDSFIDRWKLSEAYSLAAIYAQQPLEIHRCDKPIGAQAKAGWLFPELGDVDPNAPRDVRLKQLASLVTHRNNGRYTRTIVNRFWGQLMGRGLVHPLDAMHTEPWNADLLDFLGEYLVETGYDLKAVIRLIATSEAYGYRAEQLQDDPSNETQYAFRGRRSKRMTAEQFIDAVWQLTGQAPAEFDAPVLRGASDTDAPSISLDGQWIWGASAKDGQAPPAGERLVFRHVIKLSGPVATAVAVVTADNDFELYLGRRRVASSSNWMQPQTVALAPHLKPGDNEVVIIAGNGGNSPNLAGLYFEARIETKQGQALQIASDESWQYSDKLPRGNREGRLGQIRGPWESVVALGRPAVYGRVDAFVQRGLSMGGSSAMVRASLVKSDFLMRSLGRPNRDQIVTSRPSELTTLEAIDLSNGQTLASTLKAGAGRWADPERSTRSVCQELFAFALSRKPSEDELTVIEEIFGDQMSAESVEDLLWTLCMMPEFMMVR
ncbi:MAG: DUF1549 domain-containing protein [Planctomycetota bacterium]